MLKFIKINVYHNDFKMKLILLAEVHRDLPRLALKVPFMAFEWRVHSSTYDYVLLVPALIFGDCQFGSLTAPKSPHRY